MKTPAACQTEQLTSDESPVARRCGAVRNVRESFDKRVPAVKKSSDPPQTHRGAKFGGRSLESDSPVVPESSSTVKKKMDRDKEQR